MTEEVEMSDSTLAANLSRANALVERIRNRITADTHDMDIIRESRDRLQEEVNRRRGARENPPT